MPTTNKVAELKSRVTENYLLDMREGLLDSYEDWHDRQEKTRKLVRGEWTWNTAGEVSVTEEPVVMNLAETVLRDVARLSAEVEPITRCRSRSDEDTAQKNAWVREAVADTYWAENRDISVQSLAMDLAASGALFLPAWIDKRSEYPQFMRVDPMYCFPDNFGGKIQDLLTIEKMKYRVADRKFDLPDPDAKDDDEVEILTLYDNKKVGRWVLTTRGGKPNKDGIHLVRAWEHKIDCVPVAFRKLPSYDGAFRGIFDQLSGSLRKKNEAVKLMLQDLAQRVYAPWEVKNIMNPDAAPSPKTIYKHNPSAQESFMRRVDPAEASGQVFALVDFMDTEQRGQIGYPRSRQGEVSQSIASGSFVSSTQGQLSSIVLEIQKLIGGARSDLNEILYALDEQHKDETKPLIRAVDGKNTYKPTKDIRGQYQNQVVYGAGAGLDRLNTDTRINQHLSLGLISRKTARMQGTEYLDNLAQEEAEIEKETVKSALLQRITADPNTPLDLLMDFYMQMAEKGGDITEAVKATRERAEEAARQQQGETQAIPTAGQPSPEDIASQQLSLTQGGIPGEADELQDGGFKPSELEFQSEPLAQVFID